MLAVVELTPDSSMMTVSAESEAGEAGCLPQLPVKSRSLRQSSVAKRLRVESGAGVTKAGAGARVKRLSRYRRKTENAKERERMKKFNQAFENLRQKLPNRELLSEKSISGEKDTKVSRSEAMTPELSVTMLQVSALRSAIAYIKNLQSLVADCDAGKLGQEVYTDSRRLDSVTSRGTGETEPVRGPGRGRRAGASKGSASRQRQRPAQARQRTRQTEVSGGGVNEISLHISLLEPSPASGPPAPSTVSGHQPPATAQGHPQVLYILHLDDKNIQHLQ